ncbi:hypothetical protein BH18ACT2_BH18ACT2_12760 [soil metagenome]
MGASWLWAAAHVRRRWPALAVLAVLVAVAVGSTLALVAGARRADSAVDRFADTTELAEVVAFLEDDPNALAESLPADPRVRSVDISTTVLLVPEPMEPGELGFSVIGSDGGSPGGLGRPLLLEGRYPAPGSTDEIMVNERAAETYGFEVGTRTMALGLPSLESFESEPVGEVVVVGISRLALDLVGGPSTQSLAVAGPSLLDGRWAEAARIGAIVWIDLHDRGDAAAVVNERSSEIERGDVQVTEAVLASPRRAADLQQRGLLIGGGVVALTGLVTIAQALSRHLATRREDGPTLAALGMTPRELQRTALIAVAPGLIGGCLLALAVAVVWSPLLPLGLARRADPDVGVNVDWAVAGIGVVVALGAITAAALTGIRRWGRPGAAPSTARPAVAARLSNRLGLRPRASAGVQLALSSGVGRVRLPVKATLTVLVASTAVTAGALVVRSSLDGLLDDSARYGQPWDVQVAAGDGDLRADARAVEADPRVEGVDLAHGGEVNVQGADGAGRQVPTVGLEGATGPMWLAMLEGRVPAGAGEIAMGSTPMDALGLRVGDTTTVSGPCGERDVTVVGRAIVPLLISGDDPDDGTVVPLATFDELCLDQLIAQIDENRGLLLRLRNSDEAGAMVAEFFAAQRYAVASGLTPSNVSTLADLRAVPVLVVATVGLLGAIAAGHAMVLAVRRRRGDLAVLRALGMRPRDVRGVIGWQAVAMALVAIGLGIPIGIVAGRLVWAAIAEPADVLIRIDVHAGQLAAVATVVVVVMLALAVWPARRAARLTPTEGLRAE